jgi:hypothetical protein
VRGTSRLQAATSSASSATAAGNAREGQGRADTARARK